MGFRQLLGTESLWHVALSLPIFPAILGSVVLLLLFSETPKALLLRNRDSKKGVMLARQALQLLRNRFDVEQELEEIRREAFLTLSSSSEKQKKGDAEAVAESGEHSGTTEVYTLKRLFISRELRWPLITSVVLVTAVQLSGINAVKNYLFTPKKLNFKINIFLF